MILVILVTILPFLILATVLSRGKGASMLAGYNTMSESEKAQYDEVAMCKFMGKIMYGISFSLLLFLVGNMLKNKVVFAIGIILFLALIIFALVYANTGNRFKKNV